MADDPRWAAPGPVAQPAGPSARPAAGPARPRAPPALAGGRHVTNPLAHSGVYTGFIAHGSEPPAELSRDLSPRIMTTFARHMDAVPRLRYAGYAYDDALMLDLYGSVDEDGHHVESIAVAGTTVEIAQLFNARQMEHMANWVDLKDGSQIQREWADRHRHHAAAYGR